MTCSDCDGGHQSRGVVRICDACKVGWTRHVACLGERPLPNRLRDSCEQAAALYPLHLVQCSRCAAVQLTWQATPAAMFGDYPYYSSQSQTMLDHAASLVELVLNTKLLTEKNIVVEIGSNDGYLLRNYVERGVRAWGFDPAPGPGAVARERHVDTIPYYFDEYARERLDVDADVIHANNVLAHVPNPGSVIRGVKSMLKPDGLFIIETPWLWSLLEGCEFDTIYHEHRWYWSVEALAGLLARNGMQIRSAGVVPMHGGSLRVVAGHDTSLTAEMPRFIPERERALPLMLDRFEANVAYRIDVLRDWWAGLESDGPVWGYGAAAKGIMLLNALGVAPDAIVDSTPAKQGKTTPGFCSSIRPPEVLPLVQPPNCVILAWNFADEIARKAEGYAGRLWAPMPQPRRIEASHAVTD